MKKLTYISIPLCLHTRHCLGHLVLVQSLPTIHTSHQFLEQMHLFEAIFDIFVRAVFRPLRSNHERGWTLRLQPQNIVISSDILAANLEKVRLTSLWFQSSDLFVFFIVPQRPTLVHNARRKISKSNKPELWNRLSYRGLPYFFRVGSQTFRTDY